MLKVQIMTDRQITDEVNESLKTNFKQLWWIAVIDNSVDKNDADMYYAFEDEIRERYNVDYLGLAKKHYSNVENSSEIYPHDENYFDTFKNAYNCAKELIYLLSEEHECNQHVFRERKNKRNYNIMYI